MIDTTGVSDAAYHPFAEGLGVGVAVEFPPRQEIKGLDEDILRRNPEIARTRPDGTWRGYLPARTEGTNGFRVVEFIRWFDWENANKCQLVLRRKTGGLFAICARFGETQVFGFERPERGAYRYTNLDLHSKTDAFNPVFVRVGSHPGPYTYYRLEAVIEDGSPVVTVRHVKPETVPVHLLPR